MGFISVFPPVTFTVKSSYVEKKAYSGVSGYKTEQPKRFRIPPNLDPKLVIITIPV